MHVGQHRDDEMPHYMPVEILAGFICYNTTFLNQAEWLRR